MFLKCQGGNSSVGSLHLKKSRVSVQTCMCLVLGRNGDNYAYLATFYKEIWRYILVTNLSTEKLFVLLNYPFHDMPNPKVAVVDDID